MKRKTLHDRHDSEHEQLPLIWLFRPLLAVAVLMRSERRGDVENTVRSVYKGMEIASRFGVRSAPASPCV